MASRKAYAYYLRGKQIAIIEQDSILGDGQTLTPPGLNDVGPDGDSLWKSPLTAVADGLEIEYVYSPRYSITNTNTTHTTLTNYKSASSGGYLKVKGGSVNYDTTLDVGDHIVLRNAGQFNGLHKIRAFEDAAATNDSIIFNTKYSGSSSWSEFEETVTLYYSIDVLNDESDVIDLPDYLAKALVYYIKAKLAEDAMELELKLYFMKEFHAIVEKYENSKVWGARMISSGPNAIR